MARVDDIGQLVTEIMTLGLSTIVGITALPFQSAVQLKYLSGGSLEIGGTYSLSAGASTAFTWGKGYLMGTSEVYSANSIGAIYMAATGATTIVHVIRALGPGST